MATRDYEPFAAVRSCCCVGYLTNPGGRCCMDFPQGRTYVTDKIVISPEPVAPPPDTPLEWKTIRVGGITIAQGWQCPACGVIHSPSTEKCDCQKRNMVTSGNTTTGTVIR